MVYQFNINDFYLLFQFKNGAVVTIKHDNKQNIFGLTKTGDAYILMEREWRLLNTKRIKSKDPGISLIKALLKFPIEQKYLHLSDTQIDFFSRLINDLSKNNLTWLDQDDYYIKNNQILYKDSWKDMSVMGNPNLIIKQSDSSLVLLEMNRIKKSPKDLELEKKYPEFYKLVDSRSKWKREHPNWKQEKFPSHEKYIRYIEEKQKKVYESNEDSESTIELEENQTSSFDWNADTDNESLDDNEESGEESDNNEENGEEGDNNEESDKEGDNNDEISVSNEEINDVSSESVPEPYIFDQKNSNEAYEREEESEEDESEDYYTTESK
uniref:Uncharacterized protein n=1 Tax=Pithovirus LCPAC302 TaxID=2506593 RepID=A0A481Z724_9VIRU|nr:MAG: uncharacterized protein LCPAC302_01870 [Pithovirus LCPAC302]